MDELGDRPLGGEPYPGRLVRCCDVFSHLYRVNVEIDEIMHLDKTKSEKKLDVKCMLNVC